MPPQKSKAKTRTKRRAKAPPAKPGAGGLPSARGAAIARIVELARSGMTQEGIAIQLAQDGLAQLSQRSIAYQLKRLEEKGVDVGPRRRRQFTPRSVASALAQPAGARPATTPRSAPESDTEDGAELEQDSPIDDADLGTPEGIRKRLGEMRNAATKTLKNGNISYYSQLCKLEADLTEKLQKLTPAPPPDPAKDPANLEARDAVRSRIGELIQRHEAKRGELCAPCVGKLVA